MIRALLFLAIALPAAAQQTQAPPAEPKKEPERRPLNLRLENPSSFATITPPEKPPARELPALGGDARKIDPSVPIGERSENPAYPKDTAPIGK